MKNLLEKLKKYRHYPENVTVGISIKEVNQILKMINNKSKKRVIHKCIRCGDITDMQKAGTNIYTCIDCLSLIR